LISLSSQVGGGGGPEPEGEFGERPRFVLEDVRRLPLVPLLLLPDDLEGAMPYFNLFQAKLQTLLDEALFSEFQVEAQMARVARSPHLCHYSDR
jgi:hypothetical protein